MLRQRGKQTLVPLLPSCRTFTVTEGSAYHEAGTYPSPVQPAPKHAAPSLRLILPPPVARRYPPVLPEPPRAKKTRSTLSERQSAGACPRTQRSSSRSRLSQRRRSGSRPEKSTRRFITKTPPLSHSKSRTAGAGRIRCATTYLQTPSSCGCRHGMAHQCRAQAQPRPAAPVTPAGQCGMGPCRSRRCRGPEPSDSRPCRCRSSRTPATAKTAAAVAPGALSGAWPSPA